MRFILVTSQYPSESNLYANGFVHSRVLEYIKYGHQIQIYVNNNSEKIREYNYDGIDVRVGNKYDLELFIENYSPDKILVHFIDRHLMKIMQKNKFKYPMIIWVHGSEALGWYRRLFNVDIKFIKYVLQNMIQMISLRKFINNSKKENVKFIFVSNWMKKITEKDTMTKIDNYEIPNVINENIFKFEDKQDILRKNILMIRPFNSKKYANDIAINAIVELSKKDIFEDLNITIIGKGKDFEKLVQPLKSYKNINLKNTFLTHSEIYEQHKRNGIILCPTRQDAQGVSMCEAMSSGLIPITSNNTAIPEFVEDEVSGFLTNNYKEIASKIEYLYNNPKRFEEMSKSASFLINEKCSVKKVISKELEIMTSY
ncbi:glycosyltransferase family 4 protein [Romboutsia ilealis]|uniref:glycosyltransferase family 4 protein n=1 Tax=Romboutsia ilealis TaxID=1115758 RepID=UPI002730B81F|nr:glycosyltransferase family 4 protein [Romboutsia ilealis]